MKPFKCLRTIFLSLTAMLLCSTVHAKEIRIQFVAFNDDSSQVLVKVEDANLGTSLQVREVGTNTIKKAHLAESKRAEQRLMRRLRRRFPKTGIVDQVGPRNFGTIMGAPDGKGGYNILVMKDNRVGVLGTVVLAVDKDNPANRAKGMLKEVVWSENGSQILVVLNQKMTIDTGTSRVDDIHYFQYRSWDIKWLKAEEPKPSGD
jgi:hypothetical protein